MVTLIFDDDVAERPDEYQFPPNMTIHLFDRADDCVGRVGAIKPDVVLMDYHMRSSFKGEMAIRELRQHYGAEELPIIGISSAESLNARLVSAGANRAVLKPHLELLLIELYAAWAASAGESG